MPKLELHHRILIALVLGATLGMVLNRLGASGALDPTIVDNIAYGGKQAGTLFLRLLKMVVVPLIVCSLISGVTGMGDLDRLGKLGGRTFVFYMATSLLAIATGILVVNLLQPGVGVDLAALQATVEESGKKPSVVESDRSIMTILWDQILRMVPTNPIKAAADGDMLPMIFFSIVFGVGLSLSKHDGAKQLAKLVKVGFDVMMRITMWIIDLAPYGVFGFILYTTATLGAQVFAILAMYMITVVIALGVHAFVTLPILLRVLGGRSPLDYARSMQKALLTAFSTASSNATLPLTMRCVEDEAGVSQKTSAFVLPLGATINMDGTALYEAVAVLFIAQAYGHDLGLAQQIIVAFTALLASIGAAGIPHAGLVMMVIVLEAVGLPTSAVALILGVDRVLDMCRTTVNVWSDSTAAALIDRYDRSLGDASDSVDPGDEATADSA